MRTAIILALVVAAGITGAPGAHASDAVSMACQVAGAEAAFPLAFAGQSAEDKTLVASCMQVRTVTGPVEVPPSTSGGVNGADTCDRLFLGVNDCYRAMIAQGNARIWYTQVELGCVKNAWGGETCDYAPTFHASASSQLTGHWIMRATTSITNYPGGDEVDGSRRSVSCAFDVLAPNAAVTCAAQTPNLQLTAGNFNAYQWHGDYTVTYVDALGNAHLQARGHVDSWLAQYFQG